MIETRDEAIETHDEAIETIEVAIPTLTPAAAGKNKVMTINTEKPRVHGHDSSTTSFEKKQALKSNGV